MEKLAEYLSRHNVTQQVLAARAGIATNMVSAIKTGRRRPSPEVAKRIEAATNGEVPAANLLGVADTGGKAERLNEGRWLLTRSTDGGVFLPTELLAEMGFGADDRLLIRAAKDQAEIISTDAGMRRLREELRRLVPPGVSLVDELIAERRAEAAREEAEANGSPRR